MLQGRSALFVLLGVATVTLHCAGVQAPLDPCPVKSAELPPPTAECIDESRVYRASIGQVVGKSLMGWRSYPGSADFSISFGPNAEVTSVCLRDVSGKEVTKRTPQASHQIRRLGRAPRCFADRRIEIEWESGLATDHSLDRHERECRREARRLLKPDEQCVPIFGASSCSQSVALRKQQDHHITQCVLRRAPLTIHSGADGRITEFLPIDDAEVSADIATQALEECDRRQPDRQAAVACMEKFGWVPLD